jgi:phosphomannomutase
VLVCDLVAGLRAGGSSVPEALDGLARRHGVHLTSAATAHVEDAAQVMTALRRSLPARLGGAGVTTTDLASAPGNLATDALIFTGRAGDASLRLAIRPSGTEPKIKCYTEIRIAATDDLAGARTRAGELATALDADAAKLLQRGPN